MRKKILFSFCIWMLSLPLMAQELMSIAEARQQADNTLVRVRGIVTTGSDFDGRLRYFQDATGGMVVYGGVSDVNLGDSIEVVGRLAPYRGLQEITQTASGADFAVTVISPAEENVMPEPIPVLAKGFSEDLEAMLLTMIDVRFITDHTVFAYGNYTIEDSLGNRGLLRIGNSSNTLIGQPVPGGLVQVTGVLSQFDQDFQIMPRGVEDVVAGLTVDGFSQLAAGRRSLTFGFTTSLPSNAILRYKPYNMPEEAFDTIRIQESGSAYQLTVPNLEPAQFYNVEVYAEAVSDTDKKAAFANQLYATRSESTGTMEVFFNYLPQELPSQVNLDRSRYLPNKFDSLLAANIDRANYTIDVAIYNVNQGAEKVIQALNRARQRGVRVRYITNREANSYGPANLQNIPVLACECPENPDGPSPLMHNKFVVIDAASALNSYVLTGSANWTNNNLFDDPNDILLIQDQAIAKAFTVEFEEMWGSSGTLPNKTASLFGEDKINNVPHQYIVGGDLVELYFSPSDATNTQILRAVNSTRSDVRFALADLTRSDLTQALIEQHRIGWSVKGLIENAGDASTERLADFAAASVDVSDTDITIHHKFMVVNALRPDADPMVVTGSHNWSLNADIRNDENMLIIHDAALAEAYLNHWRVLYYAITGKEDAVLTATEEQLQLNPVSIYPNPSTGKLFIEHTPGSQGENLRLKLMSLNGQQLWAGELSQHAAEALEADLSGLKPGLYLLQIQNTGTTTVKKIILN